MGSDAQYCTTTALEALASAGINIAVPEQSVDVGLPPNLNDDLWTIWALPLDMGKNRLVA